MTLVTYDCPLTSSFVVLLCADDFLAVVVNVQLFKEGYVSGDAMFAVCGFHLGPLDGCDVVGVRVVRGCCFVDFLLSTQGPVTLLQLTFLCVRSLVSSCLVLVLLLLIFVAYFSLVDQLHVRIAVWDLRVVLPSVEH